MAAVGKQDKMETAITAGEEFSKLFYNTLDKNRHKLPKLYMDDATLVWNGNGIVGKDAITKFYESLPGCETTLTSLDCQPLMDEVVHGQMTILVMTAGFVKFQGKTSNPFQENFMLSVQGEVWKVVSDCFRFQETI